MDSTDFRICEEVLGLAAMLYIIYVCHVFAALLRLSSEIRKRLSYLQTRSVQSSLHTGDPPD